MSWAAMAPALLLPPAIYVTMPIRDWPLGALVLLGPLALVVAIVLAVRHDRPALWWVLLPVVVAEAWMLMATAVGGWGWVICLVVQIASLGWLVWANRENWIIAGLATFFCLTYSALPFIAIFMRT